ADPCFGVGIVIPVRRSLPGWSVLRPLFRDPGPYLPVRFPFPEGPSTEVLFIEVLFALHPCHASLHVWKSFPCHPCRLPFLRPCQPPCVLPCNPVIPTVFLSLSLLPHPCGKVPE